MPDFLSKILDRSMQREPVLQRRRRSLFEPELPPTGPLTLEDELTEPVGRSTQARNTEQKARVEVVVPREGRTGEEAEPVRSARSPEIQLIDRSPAPPRAERPHESKPTEQSPQFRPIVTTGQETPLTPTSIVGHHITEQHFITQLREMHQHTERVVERPSVTPIVTAGQPAAMLPLAASNQPPSQPRDLSREPVERGSMKEPAPFAPITEQPGVPIPDWARDATPKVSTQASLPPIQINIGRIEVRANHAQASPSPGPRPTTPRLSLEEYLRGRSRGRS